MTVNDSENRMRDFMTTGGWDFPVMMRADSAANDYGVRFIPTIVVIDREGRIAEMIVGTATASDLSAVIDGLSN